ncbi:hypothetical protein A3709_19530 [Halioglobus sp. HI00S01]|uniref:phosphoadenosine phosphosulfate reductase domain-containing protein n=1 Tax=Halioglobus sp. HI00S01 TaxID=1822214 RepID=UPI0007C3E7DC|nr:phosphoadenosine phosphosulfate reductase family protein [Halioglobus sp. HI00S01]KZX57817.1 hypothetical protein A3709_19530 [Halioglobus sp. HI00S01]
MNAVAQYNPGKSDLINSSEVIDLSVVQHAVYSVIGCRQYELPEADVHIVPVSGGVDSSVVALVMKALFPDQHFLYVFSDTGVETIGTYEAIERIEKATGQNVIRASAKQNLFEIIDDFGSFLPSGRVRYCTRMAKIAPFKAFMGAVTGKYGKDAKIATYVGIRADEGHRSAADFGNEAQTHMPLKDLGVGKREVFKILNATIGIPDFYQNKSRSGCSVCIFSRRSEIIDQWARDPETVKRASDLEKLADSTESKLMALPTSVAAQLGVGRNHLSFPMPGGVYEQDVLPWERVRDAKRKADRQTGDLFGGDESVRMFVAVEFSRFWGGSKWEQAFQTLITYSSSLGGLKTSLKHFWKHRVDTREVQGCYTEDDLRNDLHVGIFEVIVDDASDLDVDMEGSYTWQSDGTPLLLIRKTTAVLENILLGSEIDRLRNTSEKLPRWDRDLLQAIDGKTVDAGGEVVWCGMFERPTESDLYEDIDIKEAPEPCLSCSR